GEEWSNPSKLHDALPSVHDRNLILAHQFFATLSNDEFNLEQKNKVAEQPSNNLAYTLLNTTILNTPQQTAKISKNMKG
ncbi:MAG: hypothetical protein OSJ61_20455, partial [Lachnospiraceae bacterium]|nr:hypothetical protein [Lachnospiraceae bacterium]